MLTESILQDNGKNWFRNVCLCNGLLIPDTHLWLLEQYVDLLEKWNSKVNLISRREEHSIWLRHILGSIAFMFHRRFEVKTLIADVGTGGGFPGIPLAILFPDIELVLIDSIQKKINAVSDILARLELKNARAVIGRAEKLSLQVGFVHTFDYVVARAVAPANQLIKWVKPLLKPSNQRVNPEIQAPHTATVIARPSIVMLKGGDLTREIAEAKHECQPRSVTVHQILIEGLNSSDALKDKKVVIFQI